MIRFHQKLLTIADANVIDSHLANIINNDITNNFFSEKAKVASVRPIFKKNEREEIENYRPVSILNCFSKVYEKFLLEKFEPFKNSFLSEYMAAYRKKYSTNHVLIRLIENWKNYYYYYYYCYYYYYYYYYYLTWI